MKHFYAALPTGEIRMSGICGDDDLEHQAFPGAEIHEGVATVGVHYRDGSGAVVPIPQRPTPNHDWDWGRKGWLLVDQDEQQARELRAIDAARKAAYPAIGDQLDAIWKEIAALGPKTPDASAILERIAAVKASHPKPAPNNP